MTGHQYAKLVARYLAKTYGGRGIDVYREIRLGKSIIGKNRSLDLLLIQRATQKALAIECKYQSTTGTADEKIPYALDDMAALWIPGCIAYAGAGFSEGVIHMLRASKLAAYCLPDPETLIPTSETRELDHILASVFGWWDVILQDKTPINIDD